MMRTPAALPALLSLTGCLVYTESRSVETVTNATPYIPYAEAGCEPDGYYHDFVWWFDADVDDADGPSDVVEVYVDVYDSWDGSWVDGFPLDPAGGITWYSAWVGNSTYLDCEYSGYEVDFTAVDVYGATAIATVVPYTW